MSKKNIPPSPPNIIAPSVTAAEVETEDGVIPEVEVSAVTSSTGYLVAEGKSVCCGGVPGIIGPGEEISASHLSSDKNEGELSLSFLVKSGVVKKV